MDEHIRKYPIIFFHPRSLPAGPKDSHGTICMTNLVDRERLCGVKLHYTLQYLQNEDETRSRSQKRGRGNKREIRANLAGQCGALLCGHVAPTSFFVQLTFKK